MLNRQVGSWEWTLAAKRNWANTVLEGTLREVQGIRGHCNASALVCTVLIHGRKSCQLPSTSTSPPAVLRLLKVYEPSLETVNILSASRPQMAFVPRRGSGLSTGNITILVVLYIGAARGSTELSAAKTLLWLVQACSLCKLRSGCHATLHRIFFILPPPLTSAALFVPKTPLRFLASRKAGPKLCRARPAFQLTMEASITSSVLLRASSSRWTRSSLRWLFPGPAFSFVIELLSCCCCCCWALEEEAVAEAEVVARIKLRRDPSTSLVSRTRTSVLFSFSSYTCVEGRCISKRSSTT